LFGFSTSRYCLATTAILLTVLATTRPAQAASSDQLLQEAVREYQAALESSDRDERLQQFRRAEMLFARIVAGSHGDNGEGTGAVQNPDLYVNLGNAALGAERLGPAIAAYRRALELDPDHARARQNLRHARSLLPDWVPRPEEGGILDTFFAWTGQLSRREQQLAAALLFLITAALLAASVRWRRTVLRNIALIPAILWSTMLAILFVHTWNDDLPPAVVVGPETVARAADAANAPVRFSQPLPSGTEVQVIERRADWSHVRLADGRDAWVQHSNLESARP
jgi:tetratricopeptide (TPR) repeat protein